MDLIDIARGMADAGNFEGAAAHALIAIAENTADIAPLLACLDERLEYLEYLGSLGATDEEEE